MSFEKYFAFTEQEIERFLHKFNMLKLGNLWLCKGSLWFYKGHNIFIDKHSSYVDAVTNTVINESGAFTAWEKVLAIQDYLINGNSTTNFTLNYDGSGRTDDLQEEESDIAHWILNNTLEGSCDEFTTVFSVMLRLATVSL